MAWQAFASSLLSQSGGSGGPAVSDGGYGDVSSRTGGGTNVRIGGGLGDLPLTEYWRAGDFEWGTPPMDGEQRQMAVIAVAVVAVVGVVAWARR